jgi:hypothetical protein
VTFVLFVPYCGLLHCNFFSASAIQVEYGWPETFRARCCLAEPILGLYSFRPGSSPCTPGCHDDTRTDAGIQFEQEA